uniref:LOW QUALITY PROTEIN: multidrug resistance protein 2-like n=1 Tax=Saccoglossus kowalevskii TaxID=10224 RepID=A0ABM0M3F6_SACKO|nr:PREDICTED: LOW QUALITY PROTEIN: multidrug resistance protein 2-like [Saccoglossus kowalevskii]
MRTLCFHSVMKQEIKWFDTHPSGEVTTRLNDDVNKIKGGIGDKLGHFVQFFSTFVAGFIVGLVYGWELTLVLLCVTPFLAVCASIMVRLMTRATNLELDAYAKAGAVAEEVLSAIRTVAAFGGEPKEAERYGENLKLAKHSGVRKGLIQGAGMGATMTILFTAYGIGFWVGANLVITNEKYTVGTVLIVFFSVLMGAFSLGNAAPAIGDMSTARGAARTIWDIIDLIPFIDSSSKGGTTPNISGNVRLEDVEFEYPSRADVKVLKGVSLTIDVGQTVALVGSSGSGKSTAVQLIQRFYDVAKGCRYDTLVGERGAALSGGQKQRIAIARALVRDPKILLLDEATSALDTESEATVQVALDKASVGRTTLVIAHSLSSILFIYYYLTIGQYIDEKIIKRKRAGSSLSRSGSDSASIRKRKRTSSFNSNASDKSDDSDEEEVDIPDVSMKRILKMNAPEWPYILCGTLAAAVNGACQPVFAVIFSKIVAVFALPDDEILDAAAPYCVAFVIIGVIQGLGYLIQNTMFGKSGEELTMRLRYLTFTTMLHQEIGWFDRHTNSTGALTTKLASEASLVQGVASEGVDNIRTVASLTREERFCRIYSDLLYAPYKLGLKNAHIYGVTYGFSQAIMFFVMAAAFRFGAFMMEIGEMTFEEVFLVFAVMVFGAMAVGQTTSFAPDAAKARVAANQIFYFTGQGIGIDSGSTEGLKPVRCISELELHDVRFRYPTRPDVPVLRGSDLKVNPGQRVALVGSSGCGKSTVVQLTERFYDTIAGSVTLDGNDLKDLNIQWLRQQLGIVSQEPILFDRTIKDNIAYGDNSREVPMNEIIQAAKDANIHAFVQSLPLGYDTRVGDKGAQLSGGQKQRVAIARALVRNPKILLLDEATSALDTESEKVVQDALDRASEGRTCIVIAHRLSTIQDADKIVVIQNGKIVEEGKHDDLLSRQEVYYRLNNAQLVASNTTEKKSL